MGAFTADSMEFIQDELSSAHIIPRFRNPRLRFARQQFDGWGGGAYSGDVAAYGYDGDDDFAPEDLHFRVQESFGPGDIGRPSPPPPQAYDNGPWDSARMDPWHGYGSRRLVVVLGIPRVFDALFSRRALGVLIEIARYF